MTTHLTLPEPVNAYLVGPESTHADIVDRVPPGRWRTVANPTDRPYLDGGFEIRTDLGNWHPIRFGDWIVHFPLTDGWGIVRDGTPGFDQQYIAVNLLRLRIGSAFRASFNAADGPADSVELADIAIAALMGAHPAVRA